MGLIAALVARVPALVWVVLALLAWGGYNRHLALSAQEKAKAATDQVKSTKQTRRIDANFSKKRQAVDDHARDVSKRLRELSKTDGPKPGDYEAPARVVSERSREDFIDLARRADETAEALAACQSWVKQNSE